MIPPEWYGLNDANRTLRMLTRDVNPRLTESSYIVLGLLERFEPATPYDLKRLAQVSTSHF